MQHADEIKLHEVVDLEQLQAVVKRYAFEMQLGAGLLEFIGENRAAYLFICYEVSNSVTRLGL